MVQLNQYPHNLNSNQRPKFGQTSIEIAKYLAMCLLVGGGLWYTTNRGAVPIKNQNPVNTTQSAEKSNNSGSVYDVSLDTTDVLSPESTPESDIAEDRASDRDDNLTEEEKKIFENN